MFEYQKKHIISKVEKMLETNKNPCKNYKTMNGADKIAQKMAQKYGNHFDKMGIWLNYSIILVPSWGRYVISFDMTKAMKNNTFMGGCITQPNFDGFFTH